MSTQRRPWPLPGAGARQRAEAEFNDEIEAYLELRERELVATGVPPAEARRMAREAFGDIGQIRRRYRRVAAGEARRRAWEEWMTTFTSDLRFAIRALRARPTLTITAVLTLAMGVGINAALFSVVNAVLLQPLPYPDSERLVRLFEYNPRISDFPIAPGNYLDYRDSGIFESAAIYTRSDMQLSDPDNPQRLVAMRVSAGFFEVLGYAPALGRAIGRQDEAPGSLVAVLSDRLWRERFDADPGVVGEAVQVSGNEFTVLGVMPPDLPHPGGAYRSVPYGEVVDLWWPMWLVPGESPRSQHFTNGIARMPAGTTAAQAQASIDAVSERLETTFPASNTDWRVRIVPLQERIVGSSRTLLLTLLAAVAVVMIIACVNVANLLLAAATSRESEVALRAALGAKRWRIVRQLLTESLALAAAGGVVGLAVGFACVRVLVAISPPGLPRTQEIGIDATVLGFTALLTLGTGVLFGLAPALRAGRQDLVTTLRTESSGSVSDGRGGVPRAVLVVAETALASLLLVCAGLLLRTFVSVGAVDPGFESRGVLAATLSLPRADYPETADRNAFHRALRERVLALPAVEAAGFTSDLPWTGYDENTGFAIVGFERPEGMRLFARYHYRSPGFFRAAGIPLLAGRPFTDADDDTSAPVVMINAAAADRFWRAENGAGDPVGSVLDLWGMERTVIGVVGSVLDTPTDEEAVPAIYYTVAQMSQDPMILTVRTSGDPAALVAPLRAAVKRLDATVPLAGFRTLDDIAAASQDSQRFAFRLVAGFAALAVTLAAVGIYAVLAFAVGQRRRELAVRRALGADRREVLSLVVRQGLRPVAIGLVIGLVGALAAARAYAALLFGVGWADPITFVAVGLLLAAVALLACYLPARRAAALNPLESLR